MALNDLISQFNASISVASEWANQALSASTGNDLAVTAVCAAQANSNLSVATQIKIDLESLLAEEEAKLSKAINNGESVSTLDLLRAQLNSTSQADQKAIVDLTATTINVELALKSVEFLLDQTGKDVKLPKKLNAAIEAISAATLSIQAASRESSDSPELAIQAAGQIISGIEQLDEAKSDLRDAIAELLAAMKKMGAPTSPGLSVLAGLEIAIGSLIDECQATLAASQAVNQTTHSFSQLEKFAEALQQIAAQAESSAEQDNILKSSLLLLLLKNDATTTVMPEAIKMINGISLSSQADQYIIINSSNSPSIPITINGKPASSTNPGLGWQAIAVAPSKSNTQFELIWKNINNGQYASWKLDANGAFIKGDILSQNGLLELEDNLGSDLNDDKSTGWNFQNGRQIQGLTLLSAQSGLAYAIKKADGSQVNVTFNGQIASKDNPGLGWIATAVTASENGNYHLYWENKTNSNHQFARWDLDASGSYRNGKILMQSELSLDEIDLQEDLNDDQRIGPFQKVDGTSKEDTLTANPENPFQVLYGLQGKDLLTSGSENSMGFDILIGGPGDDSYKVESGTSALIIEGGNNDPLDVLIAPAINVSRSKFATLEQGSVLAIFDQETNTSLFIHDWQLSANRLEIFRMEDKAYTFDQFKQAVVPAGRPLSDLSWGDWDQQFGIDHISHVGLDHGITLNKLAETFSTI